jgi:hypothetical protein
MKALKWIGITIAGIAIIMFVGFKFMMYNTKKASPEQTSVYSYNAAELSIWYSSPSKKGRKIFGGLEPFGEVWRTGANEATTFTSNVDFMFEDAKIPSGTYTLWTIPGENEWQVILNSKMYSWGVNWEEQALREPEFDVAYITVPVEHIQEVQEQLLIDFENELDLIIVWDQTKVKVPIGLNL